MYHVTLRDNLPSIAAGGLIPQVGPRSAELGETRPAIYCFPSFADCEQALETWLGEEFEGVPEGGLVILHLNVPDSVPRDSDVEYEVALLGPVAWQLVVGILDESGEPIRYTPTPERRRTPRPC